MSAYIFASTWPLVTLSPSSTNKLTISPEISGLTLTSISGYTLPLAFTDSVMVRSCTFSEVTSSPLSLPITPAFFNPTKRTMIAANPTSTQINFLFIFVYLFIGMIF